MHFSGSKLGSQKMPARAAVLLVALGAYAAAGIAKVNATEQTYLLQYSFQAGEEIRWEVLHEFQMETSVQSYEERAEGRTDSTKLWKVESIDASGNVTLVHSVPKASMWQKTTGQPDVRYDSEKTEAAAPQFADFAKNIGRPLSRIVVDGHGNLVSRDDLQQLTADTKESDALIVPFPAEPIAVGHTWNVRREVKVTTHRGESTTVLLRRRFKLKEVDSGRAFVTIETNVLSPVNDPTIKSQLIRDLANGEVIFDIASGRLVERRLELDGEAIAFNGAASRMRYRGRFVEHLERPAVLQANKSSLNTSEALPRKQ